MDKSSHVVERPRVAPPDPERTVKTLRASHDDDTWLQLFQQVYSPFTELFSPVFTNSNPEMFAKSSLKRAHDF
jgi:hypothetical protein